jgi:hypothetical protein
VPFLAILEMKYTLFLLLSILLCFLIFSEVSFAQENRAENFAFEDDSVLKPKGLKLDPFNFKGHPFNAGSFSVISSLTVSQEYTDNILAATSAESDFITEIAPHLHIQKEFRRHKFGFLGDVAVFRHWNNTDENIEEYNAELYADFEAMKGLSLPFKVGVFKGHAERKSLRQSVANNRIKKPLEFKAVFIEAGVKYKPNRFGVDFNTELQGVRYKDNSFLNGAPSVQRDRDFDLMSLNSVFSYDFSANWQPRLILSFESQDFLKNQYTGSAFDGNSRSNEKFTVLAGAKWNYKNLIISNIGLGWTNLTYKDEDVGDAGNFAFKGSVLWEPSQKTKLKLEFGRSTIEDNLIIAGVDKTDVSLWVQHELKQNLFSRVTTYYALEDFSEGNREDENYGVKLEANYILNPNFQIGAEYAFEARDSDVALSNYDKNTFLIKLVGSF